MIVKTDKGYEVRSEHRDAKGQYRRLGGPYKTRAEAAARLRQVEMFKHLDAKR